MGDKETLRNWHLHKSGIGPTWLLKRECGVPYAMGTRKKINSQKYKKMNRRVAIVDGIDSPVYALEFSPNGSLLTVASGLGSVFLYDLLRKEEAYFSLQAHSQSVNAITFLNDHTFATCSDDTTVCVWDCRNLSKHLRTLRGHSNWVKNIHYLEKENVLVTSGFDGKILIWDNQDVPHKAFTMNGLIRTSLSPDGGKLILSTTAGYMCVIHNLDIMKMSSDLLNFKPELYRLMQANMTELPSERDKKSLFLGYGKRNRLEFIDDFPIGNNPEMVSSLHIHPDGHSVVSRNINYGGSCEWTCLHNIEERLDAEDTEEEEKMEQIGRIPYTVELSYDTARLTRPPDISPQSDEAPSSMVWPAQLTYESTRDQRMAYNYRTGIGTLQPPASLAEVLRSRGAPPSSPESEEDSGDYFRFSRNIPVSKKIYPNIPRLTHFMQEPMYCEGIIKEVCFSPDGLVICSPYIRGLRLFSYADYPEDLLYCCQQKLPMELAEIYTITISTADHVLCTKFSPTHNYLVTGSISGLVQIFHSWGSI